MSKKQTEQELPHSELEQEQTNLCSAPSLLDQLKMKKARIVQEYKKKLQKFDRQIELLEAYNAETIVKESQDLLNSE
jgi:hypothetical protein